jgi:rod shape-determining protein MreC
LKVPLTWTAAVAVIVAAIIGVAFMLNDRRETVQTQAYGATKSMLDTVATPVGEVISAPGRWTGAMVDDIRGYFFAVSENHRLRREEIELQQLRDSYVALENLNARYRSLLGVQTEPPLPMAAARVVTDSRGPFANSRLADAGTERGIAIGNPAISEHGLVGRVVGVTRGASRILVLTDVASRTPVMIDRTNARAILTGDGGPHPKLSYLRGTQPVKVGDRVLTSGDGGVFPRGLPVGVAVQGLDGAWRVKLDADSGPIDYVRILLFRSFEQLVDQKALGAPSFPPLPSADAAEIAAADHPPPPVPPLTTADQKPPGAKPGTVAGGGPVGPAKPPLEKHRAAKSPAAATGAATGAGVRPKTLLSKLLARTPLSKTPAQRPAKPPEPKTATGDPPADGAAP